MGHYNLDRFINYCDYLCRQKHAVWKRIPSKCAQNYNDLFILSVLNAWLSIAYQFILDGDCRSSAWETTPHYAIDCMRFNNMLYIFVFVDWKGGSNKQMFTMLRGLFPIGLMNMFIFVSTTLPPDYMRFRFGRNLSKSDKTIIHAETNK